MERLTKPKERRERTGIIQIVVIATVLLAALYGGLRLLGSTYEAHAARQAERKAHATRMQRAANQASEDQRVKAQLIELAEVRRARQQHEADIRDGKLRCINGQLFRRLDNGWENLPGQRCQ